MKTKRFQLLTVLLAAVMLVALSLNVMAAKSNAVTQDGLTAQLFTDKDSYKAGETVQASVQVDNHTGREVFVFTQINVPEGIKLAGETSVFDTILQNSESWNTAGGITQNLSDIATAGSTSTSDNMQAGLWIVLTILAVCGFIALFVYGKNNKTWLSIMLCMAMVAGMVVTAVPAQAADMNGDIYLDCTIQVDGKDEPVTATVSYVIYDEADEAEEPQATEVPTETPEATEAPGEAPTATEAPSEAPEETEAPATEPPAATEEPADPETSATPEPESKKDIQIYVSPNGDDSNPGTLEQPVKTLEKARELVREKKTAEVPVTVYLRSGEYVLSQTFALTEEDGGTETAPVTYRSYPGEDVVVTGSKSYDFSKFKPVEGDMKELLPTEAAQNSVLVADAKDLGLEAIELKVIDSTFWLDAPTMMLDKHNMTLTRYPNSMNSEDWIMAEAVNPEEKMKTYPTVKIEDEEIWSWTYNKEDYFYFGYYRFGWAPSFVKGEMNSETQLVTATTPAEWGSSAGIKPIRIFNSYETMDEPGEWYYDKTTDNLYIYPFEDTTENSRLYVGDQEFNLISIKDAKYISIEGMTITSSAKTGIFMENVDSCVINNCRLTGFREKALYVTQAYNSGIKNSDIAYTSVGAIELDGGDWDTLTPGNNFVSNNRIHDTNLYRCFYPSLMIDGVDGRVDHNEFYNVPEQALRFMSKAINTKIEYNVFHDCGVNGRDYSAVYAGRSGSCLGNVISYNYFYNIGNDCESYEANAVAIYLDDWLSSTTVTNNIFGPGSASNMEAIKINGGHDNVVTNNLMIDIPRMFNGGATGVGLRITLLGNSTYATTLNASMNNEKIREKWSWIQEAYKGNNDLAIPNKIADNVLIYVDGEPETQNGALSWYYTNGGDASIEGLESNVPIFKTDGTDNRSLFVDYENGDYRLNNEALQLTGFQNIDQSEIGLMSFSYDGKICMPGGYEPTVAKVTISGEVSEGKEIEAVYDFADADGDKDFETFANFYLSETAEEDFYLNFQKVSDNTTGKKFIVTEECEGMWIRCKVTPVDAQDLEGDPVWSEPVYVPITTEVDKTNLETLLKQATELLDVAEIGDKPGQWSQKEADLLTAAVTDAQAVMDNESVSQYKVTETEKELAAAIERFKTNKNGVAESDIIDANEFPKDSENWTAKSGTTPEFKNNQMTIVSALRDPKRISYTKETYTNKLFSFNLKLDGYSTDEVKAYEYGAICLLQNATADPWGSKGVVALMKANVIELQIYGTTKDTSRTYSYNIENGEDMEVVFGMYQENSTSVRIILEIDGKSLVNELVEDQVLLQGGNYFGAYATNGVSLTLGEESADAPETPEETVVGADETTEGSGIYLIGTTSKGYKENGQQSDFDNCGESVRDCDGAIARYVKGQPPAGFIYTPNIKKSGEYEVFLYICKHSSSPESQKVIVKHKNGESEQTVNCKIESSAAEYEWVSLGKFDFAEGTGGCVETPRGINDGATRALGVKFVTTDPETPAETITGADETVEGSGIYQIGTQSAGYREDGEESWFGDCSTVYDCNGNKARYVTYTGSFIYTPNIKEEGLYEVFYYAGKHSSSPENQQVIIKYKNGTANLTVNCKAEDGVELTSEWVSLGRFEFATGTDGYVKTPSSSPAMTRSGGVKFVKIDPETPTETITGADETEEGSGIYQIGTQSAGYREDGEESWFGDCSTVYDCDGNKARYVTNSGSFIYTPNIKKEGTYEVFYYAGKHSSSPENQQVIIKYKNGTADLTINCKAEDGVGLTNEWVSLGKFEFATGTDGYVKTPACSPGMTRSGGVKFVTTDPETPAETITGADETTEGSGIYLIGTTSKGYKENGQQSDFDNCGESVRDCDGAIARYVKGQPPAGFIYTPNIKKSGEYEVFLYICKHSSSPESQNVIVKHKNGESEQTVNCKIESSAAEYEWVSLGKFDFAEGTGGCVETPRGINDGTTRALGVKFVKTDSNTSEETVTVSEEAIETIANEEE